MFARRERRTLSKRVRAHVWPETGFRRAGKYLIARLFRLKSSPHGIAAGFAAGVAVSFTPLIGLHFVLAFALAFIVRGSLFAAALGTAIGNPLTFPFIFALSFWTGERMFKFASAEDPEDVVDVVFEALDETAEAEAEAAADALLDAAEHFVEEDWSLSISPEIWPIFQSMLIGSIPLAVIAYAVFYSALYFALRGFSFRRGKARG